MTQMPVLPPGTKLSLTATRLLRELMLGGFRSTASLMDALYQETRDAPHPAIIKVYVNKLRAVLPPTAIVTSRGEGYQLDLAVLQKLEGKEPW